MFKKIFFNMVFYSILMKNIAADGECWTTGCQPHSWAVVGCDQYNRIEIFRKSCNNDTGYRYHCCPKPALTENELETSDCRNDCPKKILKKLTCDVDQSSPSNEHNQTGVGGYEKRIVGYYTSWKSTQISERMMAKLTHIIYAFAERESDGKVKIEQSSNRLDQLMCLRRKFPHVKVLFSVGGEKTDDYFRTICGSSELKIKFIQSAIELMKQRGFDGIDLDWEFPRNKNDKENYVALMRDLRTALDSLSSEKNAEPYLLSFAGTADLAMLDHSFDLLELLKYANFVNVMSYNYFGSWSSETGPPAPLSYVDETMEAYLSKTKLPEKINMGFTFYGLFWKNVGKPINENDDMVREVSKVNGKIIADSLPWYEIKSTYINQTGFITKFHEKEKVPYAFNPSSKVYIGFEDEQSIKEKLKYVANHNIGGVMIWAIDYDDDQSSLLNSVDRALLCASSNSTDMNCSSDPVKNVIKTNLSNQIGVVNSLKNVSSDMKTTSERHFSETEANKSSLTIGNLPTEIRYTESMAKVQIDAPNETCCWTGCHFHSWLEVGCEQFDRVEVNKRKCSGGLEYYCCNDLVSRDSINSHNEIKRRIVGYYTGEKIITEAVMQKLTHVIYAFADTSSDGKVRITGSRLEHLLALRTKYPLVKVLFSVGGEAKGEFFSLICTQSFAKTNFISSSLKLLKKYGLDGIDIDWLSPSDGVDKSNHIKLMRNLREALDFEAKIQCRNERYILSFVGSSDEFVLGNGLHLYGSLKYADFVNVISYDYYGNWQTIASPHSSLSDVDKTMKYYVCKTGLSQKLNMGVAFYGRFWKNVENVTDIDNDMIREVSKVNGNIISDSSAWYKIKSTYINQTGFITKFHEKEKVPYAFNPSSKVYIGFEDEQSIKEKLKYVANHNIGGVMIWAIDQDDDQLSLLNSLSASSQCLNADSNDVKYNCKDHNDVNCHMSHRTTNNVNTDEKVVWREEKYFNETACLPLDRVIEIFDNDTQSSDVLYPRFITVKRCDGGCDLAGLRECLPTRIHYREVKRAKAGEVSPVYITQSVEVHAKCKCSCKVKTENCNSAIHAYEEDLCRCTCKNEHESDECHKNPLKSWNQEECKCKCKKEKICPSRLFFSHDTCRCEAN